MNMLPITMFPEIGISVIVARSCVFAALICGFILIYRWVRQRSPALATIFACGLIGRALLGVSLFMISMFDLPVLRGYHVGEGFWVLAFDARSYFDAAQAAARDGLATIADVAPSPAYVRALAAWLKIAGIAMPSAILFNVVCYGVVAVLIVALCRSTRAAVIALLAVTVSPALILFDTQPLKDPLVAVLIAVIFAGLRLWTDGLYARSRSFAYYTAGLIFVGIGVYGIGGIRPYVSAFVLVAACVAATAAVVVSQTVSPRSHRLVAATALLIVAWVAFARGSSVHYPYYRQLAVLALTDPLAPFRDLERVRELFAATGGATSFADTEVPGRGAARRSGVGTASNSSAPDASLLYGEAEAGLSGQLAKLARGVLVLFVPISVLRTIGVVTFTGGRGLLAFTDLDTIVMDLTLLACFFAVSTAPRSPSTTPLVLFTIVFTTLMVFIVAYGVTNFGTLFRFRPMIITPLWLSTAFIYNGDWRASAAPREPTFAS